MRKPDKKRQKQQERSRRRKEAKRTQKSKEDKCAKTKASTSRDNAPPFILSREYYSEAFFHFGQAVREQGYDRAPSPGRRLFWEQIPEGSYAPDKAREYLEDYLQHLETALQEVIGRNSLAYWHHVYRRFAPLPIGEDQSPTTIQITRAVIDAAIQKFAKIEFCDRIGISTQIEPARILRGYLVQNNCVELLNALASSPQLVLTDFGPDEYREVLQTEKLAYEVWRTMAQLRTVGKGAPLVVTHGEHWVNDDRSDDLDFLLSHFDDRELDFSTTATATVFDRDLDSEGVVILPRWNSAHISYRELAAIFEHFLDGPIVTPHPAVGPNFVWATLNLTSYYTAHEPFSVPFRERNGVSLESVVGVIAALIAHLYSVWHREPMYFLRMWQRAYDVPGSPTDIKRWIEQYVPIAIRLLGLPFQASDVDVEAAFNFLALTDASRALISISYGGPHAVFIPNGVNQVFIDYAYLLQRLHYLFFGVNPADQNFKGTALELFMHRGQSVLPTGEIRGADGTSRQVDAAFAAGDTLVICECRAVARSIAVEKGDPRALEKRKEVIEKALADIDEKAAWLREHRTGSNYSVDSFKWILPVGVTPFKEFIPSREARYWIDEKIPRVLSPAELRNALDDGSLLAAAARSTSRVKLG